MKKKRLNLIISLIIGASILGFFLYKLGPDAIKLIAENMNPFYLVLWFIVSSSVFLPLTLKFKIILKAYKKKVGFFMLLKQTIAAFAVSYVTPSARAGGEPLRVYMLKKEADVDMRTGSTATIIDKFIELAGSMIYGAVGLILLLSVPGVPVWFKILLAGLITFTFCLLGMIYYRTIVGRGSFSTLFCFLRLNKIAKFRNFTAVLEDVERRLEQFFVNHKKEFLLGFLLYFVYGGLLVLEFKLLLLSFGVSASILWLILAIVVVGFAGFIPVPAALGFLEAGQSGLFKILQGEGSVGLALSLMIRIRGILFTALGFAIISNFSGKQIEKSRRGVEEAVEKSIKKRM